MTTSATALFVVHDTHRTAELGQDRLALRGAGLEQLDHAGQTVRDVLTGNAAGVERTHRQLGPRLTDRLGGHDADRLARLDLRPVARLSPYDITADTVPRLVGERRADPDLGDPFRCAQRLHGLTIDQRTGLAASRRRWVSTSVRPDLDVLGEYAAEHPVAQVADRADRPLRGP